MLAKLLCRNRRLGIVHRVGTADPRLDDMKICEPETVEPFGEMIDERSRVAVSHMAKRATRLDSNAHAFGTPYTNDCAENLDQKPFPIFDRSAIQVSSLIASILQELFDQMTLTCQNLDAIEPCLLLRSERPSETHRRFPRSRGPRAIGA